MARGRHYAKLSLSNAARLSFSDLCILLFMFLSLCRLCVCVFLCSHWSLVDVPLIFFCPADHVPDWQPRVLLGMVEARSVNVKKTTTTWGDHGRRRSLHFTTPHFCLKKGWVYPLCPLPFYFYFILCFREEKSQFVSLRRDSNSRPNVRRFRGYQLNHRDDRLCVAFFKDKSERI